MNKNIINLYDHYKNTPKKLKIVCDWDEVIQSCEPYAGWLAQENKCNAKFEEEFKDFWCIYDEDYIKTLKEQDDFDNNVEYSPYGSKIKDAYFIELAEIDKDIKGKYLEIKNSPSFYQQAPFLTIAEDLLRLIKEDKVECLIFLSAYDKRKFPNGDERKVNIVWNTFGMTPLGKKDEEVGLKSKVSLQLIPFENETQGQTKANWIKQNAPDFDIFIDDNPNILKDILNEFISFGLCRDCRKENKKDCVRCPKELSMVCSPYYPATENQHDERVFLVKNEVSNLKKEDFSE